MVWPFYLELFMQLLTLDIFAKLVMDCLLMLYMDLFNIFLMRLVISNPLMLFVVGIWGVVLFVMRAIASIKKIDLKPLLSLSRNLT
ncbi:hypothetical protein D3C76_1022050 [compost metagenome]